jgi:hypothetical protein
MANRELTMNRIVPVLIAAILAAPGAALAQNTNTLDSNGNAVIAGPATISPGTPSPSTRSPKAGIMNRAPVIGGGAAGIAPIGMPPTVGNTPMGDGVAPGAAPMTGDGQHQATSGTISNAPDRMSQALVPGANSFTVGQARARFQHDGFTQVSGLHKDNRGIWRGKAMKNGQPVSVALDYQGKVLGQ